MGSIACFRVHLKVSLKYVFFSKKFLLAIDIDWNKEQSVAPIYWATWHLYMNVLNMLQY